MDQQHIIGDRFEIGQLIGWGGMGEVFRGRDIKTNQPVAIKSLRDEVVAQDPRMVERFEREGHALQHLNHLNIVKVISTITAGRKHYIVMEYVAGGSLADLISTQPQPPLARVCAIARDLANALDCAHRQQIFHRDIKPSNVLLAQDGTPRLSDFGIAHISGLASLTQTGAMLGTYPYLSPEACHGATPDERTDIWAFGVLLFELVAGRRPFEGGSPAVLSAILNQPVPDLTQLCPTTPAALSSLIHRMLEKDREKRIANVQLIQVELEQLVLANASDQRPSTDGIPTTPDAPTVALPAAPKPTAVTSHDSSSGAIRIRETPSGRAFQAERAPITHSLDFDIIIEAAGEHFTVRVQAQDDRGEIELKARSLVIPFDLKNLPRQRKDAAEWVKLARIVLRRGGEELRYAREFGEQLFGQIFTGEVLATFRTYRAQLKPGDHMRLRLRLPEQLASLPWELLYDSEERQFLVLDNDLSLVRYPRVPRPISPLRISGPLQIVAVLASPNDPNYQPIRLDRELRRVEEALKTSRLHTQIVLDVISGPNTLLQLRDRMRRPAHVLHILSHGDLDEDSGEGLLIFENAEGAAVPVNAELLRLQLRRQSSQIQLVLLNACVGALSVGNDPFSSLGVALIQSGVPAVIAMQFELADDAAAELAQIFYAELAQGAPIDLALREARLHLHASYRNRLDWIVPVLFLRAEGGILFDSQSSSANTPVVGDNLGSLKRAPDAIKRARAATKDAEQPLTIAGSQLHRESELSGLVFLRRLVNEKRRRLNIRQLQLAKLGITADPAIVIESEDLESEIHDLEHQIAEIEKGQTKRADGPAREDQLLHVLKRRRIDAALPGHAEVGQHVDLLVQIRFPNSPPLSSKDWPTKQKPTSVEQLSESVSLRFELNRETETIESIYLELQIVAPGFAIEGTARRRLEVPPGNYSRRAAFLLTPTKPGVQRVNVEVYTIDNVYLGSIPVETTVGSSPAASTTNIANLLFQVTVEPEHQALLAPPAAQQRSDLIMAHIHAGDVAKALELIEQTLQQQPADREAIMWLAQLIENPAAAVKQRLRAARLAARHDDARPGVCTLPPAMAALADSAWEIARYPITCAQFRCFMEEDGYNPQQPWWRGDGRQWLRAVRVTEPEFWHDERFGQSRPNHPVVGVSWFEAEAFCSWLTQSRRYNPDGFIYRLPSEAEWQHAAQGGQRRDYPWGTELPSAERANFDKQYSSTTPVGCFVPGATPTSQIYDLAGNVYEWTSSIYQRKRADQASPPATKIAPVEWWVRVRGGSWRSSRTLLRLYNRHSYSPDYNSTSLGFRVVRSPATETESS